MHPEDKDKRVFYGWWIVAANAIITFWVAGTYYYGFGAFVNPLKAAFGWSTAQIAFAFSIRSLESGPVAPLAGFLVDRLGARAVTLGGVVITGTGFFLLGNMSSLTGFYVFYLVAAIGASACLGVVPMTNVANWFVARRGRAMGIYSVGAGLSGLIVPAIAFMLGAYAWHTVLMAMAVGTWIVGIPLALLLRHKPEQHGLQPDGAGRTAAGAPPVLEGTSVRDAVRDRNFWFISVALALSFFSINAVTAFLIPYLSDPVEEQGLALSGGIAGAAMTFLTVASLSGRFGFGWLADRYDVRKIYMAIFAVQAGGLLSLSLVQNVWHLVPFFLLFGPAYGGVITLRPVILANYFGRRSLGTIQGLSIALMTVGGVLAPILVGTLRDRSGSYSLPFLLIAAAVAVSIPLFLLMGKQRYRAYRVVPAPGSDAP